MRIAVIIFAAFIGLVGLRLILTALRTVVMFLRVENVPIKAKESLFRDMVWGILCLILAFFLIV
jgi:hypothetical protein